MQQEKCSLELYRDFLIASQHQFSGSELSKVAPSEISPDAVSRWLKNHELTPHLVWQYARSMVDPTRGHLIIDDTLLDKPYAQNIPLVKAQYSGKHHGVAKGICLVTLLWTDGERIIPVDYRVYDPSRDGKTKNDHAREMLESARKRGFSPDYVLLDSWYSSIENLKAVKAKGWKWIAELKSNRLVSITQGTYLQVKDLDWTSTQVHRTWLKAYGFVLAAEIDLLNGDLRYVATNDLELGDLESIETHYGGRWKIEDFHRGVKQCCGIERCYSQVEQSQRNHILCAFLAFLKLEWERLQYGISWYEQKWSIPRKAVTDYLANA